MTSSRKNDLPPGLSSMWRVCKLGYRHEPALLLAAFVISLLAALPDSLVAVWLKVLGDGMLRHDRGRVLAAYSMMLMGMAPIGALISGVLAEHIGAPATVAAGGIACGLGAAAFAMHLPGIRQEARELILAQSATIPPEAS